MLPQTEFQVGDAVEWTHANKLHRGRVRRVNPKSLTVTDTKGRKWRCHPSLIAKTSEPFVWAESKPRVKRATREQLENCLQEVIRGAPEAEPEYKDWGGDTERAEIWGGTQEHWRIAEIVRKALGEHVAPIIAED